MNIGIIFGGKSVEHDVSIVSAQVVSKGFAKLKHEITPIYISPEGKWIVFPTGKRMPSIDEIKKTRDTAKPAQVVMDGESDKLVLRKPGFLKKEAVIDLALLMMHGTNGEDGSLQGVLEMINVPYTGSNVGASALSMDKVHMKQIFKSANIPITNHMWFLRSRWEKDSKSILKEIGELLEYPIFIKPANLGSSIGITKATDDNSLKEAIEVAVRYDRKIIAEQGVINLIEINCAVIGNDDPQPSVLEQPVSYTEFLTFEEKYIQKGGSMKGAKSRVKIPAPLSEDKTKEIKELAIKTFKILDCSGIARVDFLLDEKHNVYVNEINPIPGSLQQHLWKASNIPLDELVERLIELAMDRHAEKEKNLTFYRSELL
jgi:D-alanine-D-alanine ligase